MRRSLVRRFLRPRLALIGACYGVLCSAGCADDASPMPAPEGDSAEGSAESVESGCAAWRSASCHYISRCGKAVPSCAAQFGAIQCLSETESEHCAAQLREAKCGELPAACQTTAIANSVSAVAACQQYVDAVCSSAAHCGFDSSADACRSMQQLDCSLAVGTTASFEQCMAGLQNVSCQSWVPPDACKGVVVVR